jgi:hypothetical protein
MPNTIQPRDYFKNISSGGGMGGIPHDLRNPNGNRYVLYLYWNDGQWNWNYNWLDNDWNARNPSAVLATLFISLRSTFLFGWRVLFCKLAIPTTEHFARLVQLYGKSDVLFIVERFRFPEDQKKHAQGVRFFDCEPNVRMFLEG